jgi:hypothetical protein
MLKSVRGSPCDRRSYSKIWFLVLIVRLLAGRAIAHVVFAGFPLRRPGFDPRSSHVGFVVEKVALGQVSSEYFGFPYPFSFHQMLHTHLSSGAVTIGKLMADVPSGLSLTPSHETR